MPDLSRVGLRLSLFFGGGSGGGVGSGSGSSSGIGMSGEFRAGDGVPSRFVFVFFLVWRFSPFSALSIKALVPLPRGLRESTVGSRTALALAPYV